MVDIEWEDPPEDVLLRAENRGGKYIDVALALRADPKRWAKLPTKQTKASASGLAQSIRRGATVGFKPKGAFEAVSKDGYVWARFIGEPAPKPEPQPKGNGSDDDPPEDGPGAQHERVEEDLVDPKEVRAWARKNGWPDLSDRGRLAGEILDKYLAAHTRAELRSVK